MGLQRLTQVRNVKIFKSVDEIGKDSIDSLSNDGFYTYGWFKTAENIQRHKLGPLYVTVFDRGELVALAPYFLRSEEYYPPWKPNWFLRNKILALGNLIKLPLNRVLLCSSPFCYRSTILVDKGYDRKKAVNQISNVFDFICQKTECFSAHFFPFLRYIANREASSIINVSMLDFVVNDSWNPGFSVYQVLQGA